jgi:hypothetical protein
MWRHCIGRRTAFFQDTPCVNEEIRTGWRWQCASPHALDQPNPKSLLEQFDLQADGRLGKANLVGRRRETP